MYGLVKWLVTAIGLLALMSGDGQATTHEFYKGKTIRLIVGLSAGGSYEIPPGPAEDSRRAQLRHNG